MKRKKTAAPKRKHISHNKTHIMLKKGLVVYSAIVFVLFILISLSAFTVAETYRIYQESQREERIVSIYNAINLDNEYRVVSSNIFGEKRPYEWDNSRSYASSIEGGHYDTPANTTKKLTEKIEAAGFGFIGTEYEGSLYPQYHFKNNSGEYVRLTVSSAAAQNRDIYGTSYEKVITEAEQKAAPSYFVIKVNLDDNNE